MSYQTIRIAESQSILTLTIHRHERQNSINAMLIDEIHRALDAAERSSDCRIVVLQGEGGVFCAGMDFDETARWESSQWAQASQGGEAFLGLLKRFASIPRVIISSIDGRASGGGVGLAAASDFVFATQRSQFSLPEALWGLLPCCVLPFLIRRVGFQKAYTMTLSTQSVSAQQAAKFHLVDEVSDDPDLLIRKLSFRLTKLEAQTIKALKQYFSKMWVISEQMETVAVQEFAHLMSSPVVRQNITNFVTRQKFPWDD